jgi:hypothetical protein
MTMTILKKNRELIFHSSVVQCLSRKYRTLGLILRITKKKNLD